VACKDVFKQGERTGNFGNKEPLRVAALSGVIKEVG